MTTLKNITPHALRLRVNTSNQAIEPDETDIVLEPSGIVARVSAVSTKVAEVNGFPVVAQVFGDMQDLPDTELDVLLIGSMPVAQKAAQMGRKDVVGPNTAPKQDLRYGKGHALEGKTFAVFGFQQF